MAALSVARAPDEAAAGPDPSWRELYQVGAVAAALYVLLIIIPLVLLGVAPQPPLKDGAAILDYIAAHRGIYFAELIAFVGLSLPAMVVFLALYAALQHLNKSYAALGALVGIGSEIIALAYNSSPPSLHTGLVYLADHYQAATTAAQRGALTAAAEALMAAGNAVNGAGLLTALGILIMSLLMLKGAFARGVAYLGILTGTLGIVSEALRDTIGLAYLAYGLLLPGWFLAVGWRLRQLGRG